mmetsp:Transcript_59105/g.93618  ORF Transcript_59105/g.93618 Transcript_59105/m.93618 type:complete len:225 (+) Transcript_59105:245-919(+)
MHHNGHAHDDNHTLRCVCHGGCHCVGLLNGKGCQLVVGIEPQTRHDEIHDHCWSCRGHLHERSKSGALCQQHDDEAESKRVQHRDGKLIAHTTHAVLETFSLHEFLVLVALDGCKDVCHGCREQRSPGEVHLTQRGQDNATYHRDEAKPLAETHLLAVEHHAQQSCKGWLSCLDDLTEGHRSSVEGEDGRSVSTCRGSPNSKGLLVVRRSQLWKFSRVRIAPEQ